MGFFERCCQGFFFFWSKKTESCLKVVEITDFYSECQCCHRTKVLENIKGSSVLELIFCSFPDVFVKDTSFL